MNVSEYIASGILDVYILGGLSKEEAHEVEQLASLHPEISLEIERLKVMFEEVLAMGSVTPPDALKSKVLNAVHAKEDVRVSNTNKSMFLSSSWAMAASWAVGLFFAGLAYYYYAQWQEAETEVATLETKQQELASQYNLTKQAYSDADQKLKLVADTAFRFIALNRVSDKPHAFAKVMWNPDRGEVYLNAKYLPAVPSGKQYQLWAIVHGKPVDIGLIPTDGKLEFLQMKHISQASAFAITLENEGGSPNPTLTEMYVMGSV